MPVSRGLVLVPILVAAALGPAVAQTTITIAPPAPPRVVLESRRVTFTMNISLTLPAPVMPGAADMTRTMAAASNALYEVLNRECEVLTPSFKGTCRLARVNIGGNIGGPVRGDVGSTVSANANATFEIDVEPSPEQPPR